MEPRRPYVELLGGEGADPHPGGVGLGHAEHLADIERRDAEAGARAPHRAVRRGHEGIRAWRERR